MRYNTAKMSVPIQIIPRIQSLDLENVGCWESLHMDFVPGLNIITAEQGGLGKTTILSSIMGEVCPDNDMGLVAPRLVPGKSRIAVQRMPSGRAPRVVSGGEIPPQTDDESHGQYTMRLLRSCLAMAEPDAAILFDEEVFRVLDDSHRSKAAQLLNATTAQVICVIKRLSRDEFPEARIFSCSWDRDKQMARMRLMQ